MFKERLKWRSQNHVPMNDEDVRYEQNTLMEATEKIKAFPRSTSRALRATCCSLATRLKRLDKLLENLDFGTQ